MICKVISIIEIMGVNIKPIVGFYLTLPLGGFLSPPWTKIAFLAPFCRLGRVLAYGFPLTEFGGFHGPSSANSKLFHGSEFQLVKDRGNNKNSSSIV